MSFCYLVLQQNGIQKYTMLVKTLLRNIKQGDTDFDWKINVSYNLILNTKYLWRSLVLNI